eukprot:TRINITY_DN562_c0_g1_i1.p1 TRINITY_DN562_c0_g1~~TRINITY_DN562_c0_g1_i1.p1  ORF type:complete len:431 (+),score=63.15 TRINITY_DN562_c0_g1_i1:219-1511(+)
MVPIRPPGSLTHPLILPFLTLGTALIIAAGAVVIADADLVSWVGFPFLVVAVLLVCYISFLLILRLFGISCLRTDGPQPSSSDGSQSVFPADWLCLKVGEAQPGYLGMSIAPGRKKNADQRDLASDLRSLREDHSCDAVVTLLEDSELESMQCSDMGSAMEAAGMLWLHAPVRDKWIPSDDLKYVSQTIAQAVAWVRAGKRVLIHCNGGKGRTGTAVAAVMLTTLGGDIQTLSLSECITQMRAVRPGMLYNPLQQLYLWHLTSCLRAICDRAQYDPSSVFIENLHTALSVPELYGHLSGIAAAMRLGKVDPSSAVVYMADEQNAARLILELHDSTVPFLGPIPLRVLNGSQVDFDRFFVDPAAVAAEKKRLEEEQAAAEALEAEKVAEAAQGLQKEIEFLREVEGSMESCGPPMTQSEIRQTDMEDVVDL